MRHKLTLGIDEAGRGPVLGPMVMAAVVLDTRAATLLTRRGVRDSKACGPSARGRRERAALAELVRENASFVDVRVIDVADVDRRVSRGELNVLERETAGSMIARGPSVDRIVCDGAVLFKPLRSQHPTLEALNRGESRHAAVAAASILAKHRRDQLFDRIARRYAPLFGPVTGGGYGNAATRRFLRAYATRFRRLPPEARRSWPYPYLYDILGENYDPFAEVPEQQMGQIGLFRETAGAGHAA